MKIIDIKLTYMCNSDCYLCCQDSAIKTRQSVLPQEQLFTMLEQLPEFNPKETKIVLTGGEPTIHPDFLSIVEKLHTIGYRYIQLQSNLTLTDTKLTADDLANSGITNYGVSLHGHTAKIHETFTRMRGSFDKVIHNLQIIANYGKPITLNCVISNANINELLNYITFIGERKLAEQIQFAFLHITGRANMHHEMVPRISDAAKKIQEAIEFSGKYNIRVKTEAIPFCLMRHYEGHVAELEKMDDITVCDVRGIMNFAKHRENNLKEKCEKCKQCLFFGMCEGPWKEYPELMGWEEFQPVRDIR